ncbi:MAG: acetate--CoA ligase family protein [Vannielia sp.]|uniref:acetate--CoA ligase family protein n=1 Tax=Vannielia sp. TaxID=2813045 RepID=UPI003B8C78B0
MTAHDTPTREAGGLDAMFKPRAIALVGASDDPYKIGGRPLRYMAEAGSAVTLYPVNPTRETVQGAKAYPSVSAIPEQVDQVILAVPASRVEAAVEDGLAAGVKSFVMFSAGFAEAGEAGAAAQAALVARIRAGGARLLGPNAMGLFNTNDRIFATFSSALDRGIPEIGRVGVVSQSGAVGSYIQNLILTRGVNISKFVATGNEADVEASECLEWMAGDPETDVLVVYLETCRNGPGLMRALEVARANGKPVIVLKAGRTEAGQHVAASHTGAMAGSAAVFDAALTAAGAHLCRSLAELVELTYTCANGVLPKGRNLAIITVSGGIGVMSTDAAIEQGMALPPMSDAAFDTIRESLPLAVGLNPLDTTAATIGDRTIFMGAVEQMLASQSYGSVMLFVGNAGLNPRDPKIMAEGLTKLTREYPETLFAICTQSTPENAKAFEATGFLVFENPESCVAAFSGAARLGEVLRAPVPAPAALPAPVALPERLDEVSSAGLLAGAGLRFARSETAGSAEEAARLAGEIGYPVVLKVRSPDIAHKSEVGGVKVGLADAEAVREGFDAIMASARAAAPEAEILGVSVNQMVAGGVQCILGTHRDATFGPMVMVGLGGIYTEVLKDTVMRPAPVARDEALEMIRSLKGFALLDGARGAEKADIGALAENIVALSAFAAAQGAALEGAEINPMIVLPDGCIGVDALVIPAR